MCCFPSFLCDGPFASSSSLHSVIDCKHGSTGVVGSVRVCFDTTPRHSGRLCVTRQEFLRKLEELLEVESHTLKGEEDLQDLEGWESLTVMEFMALADESFNVVLHPNDIASCDTVAELLDLLAPHYQSSTS